jgi:hypothetical protein
MIALPEGTDNTNTTATGKKGKTLVLDSSDYSHAPVEIVARNLSVMTSALDCLIEQHEHQCHGH